MTILSGLADEAKHQSIVENALIPNQFCSPHFEWMVAAAMCEAGFYDAALKRMKERYQLQVDRKWLSTLYEMLPQDGTYNHAWNAPNMIFSKHIVGIAADKAAWQRFHVLPNLTHTTAVKQIVPSVQGDNSVDSELADDIYTMRLNSPEGTSALVGIPKSSISPGMIQANGTTVWKGEAIAAAVPGISFSGEDQQYIKFNAAPGKWIFSAKSAGRTMLFNGKNLEGWNVTFEEPATDAFNAKDGTLHVSGMQFGYIQTQKFYTNYCLQLKWRWVDAPPTPGKRRNSGVFRHATGKDKLWPACVEAQLRENNAGFMIFVDESTCDQIEKPKEAKNAAKKFIDIQRENNRFRMFKRDQGVEEKPVGQWNTYDILCQGDTISLTVHGKLANTATGCVPAAGKIGFQSEGGQLELRNVYINPVE